MLRGTSCTYLLPLQSRNCAGFVQFEDVRQQTETQQLDLQTSLVLFLFHQQHSFSLQNNATASEATSQHPAQEE